MEGSGVDSDTQVVVEAVQRRPRGIGTLGNSRWQLA